MPGGRQIPVGRSGATRSWFPNVSELTRAAKDSSEEGGDCPESERQLR
jgi:hypothetical protein